MILSLLIAVGLGFFTAQAATYVTTVYLHRTLSHRALTLRRPASLVMRILIWISTGIVPRQWVAVHRKHHANTDADGDPHSPLLLGVWKVQLANPALYRREARTPGTVDKYARDLPPSLLDRLLFDRAMVGLGIGIGLLILLLGPLMGVIAAAVHTVAYLQLNAAVNAVGHRFGRRPFDNTATNLQWLAWITAGEGLHNNHHAAPTSARLAHHRGEIDPGWWVIRTLQVTGLATVRHAAVRVRSSPARV